MASKNVRSTRVTQLGRRNPGKKSLKAYSLIRNSQHLEHQKRNSLLARLHTTHLSPYWASCFHKVKTATEHMRELVIGCFGKRNQSKTVGGRRRFR